MSQNEQSMTAAERERFVRQSIELEVPLIALSIEGYANKNRVSWGSLAESGGITLEALYRIATCYPPRQATIELDLQEISEISGTPVDELTALMSRIGITKTGGHSLVAEERSDYHP